MLFKNQEKQENLLKIEEKKTMVLKTRPNRSVQQSTDHGSRPVWSFSPKSVRTEIRPVKPVNRINRTIPSKPFGTIFIYLFHYYRPRSVGPPPRVGKAPSHRSLLLEKAPVVPRCWKSTPCCKATLAIPLIPPHLVLEKPLLLSFPVGRIPTLLLSTKPPLTLAHWKPYPPRRERILRKSL